MKVNWSLRILHQLKNKYLINTLIQCPHYWPNSLYQHVNFFLMSWDAWIKVTKLKPKIKRLVCWQNHLPWCIPSVQCMVITKNFDMTTLLSVSSGTKSVGGSEQSHAGCLQALALLFTNCVSPLTLLATYFAFPTPFLHFCYPSHSHSLLCGCSWIYGFFFLPSSGAAHLQKTKNDFLACCVKYGWEPKASDTCPPPRFRLCTLVPSQLEYFIICIWEKYERIG